MTKNVGLHLNLNQGPSKEKKSENFLPKAQEKNIHVLCIYVYVSISSLKVASELKIIAAVL